MSAFIVSKAHVAALVKFALQRRGELDGDPLQVCGMLYAANVVSVNHRYPNHTPEEPEAFTRAELLGAPDLSPVECVKACQCLAYQSCEVDTWPASEACRMVERIQGTAIAALPGYDKAAWCRP